MLSDFTGHPGGFQQQPQQTAFNAIANMPPPQQQENPDKYAPTNIFAAMKRQDFGKPEEQQPQAQRESCCSPARLRVLYRNREIRCSSAFIYRWVLFLYLD